MKQRLKLAILLVFFVVLLVFSSTAYSRSLIFDTDDFAPAPTLLYPTADDIVLTGKEYLEFRWERVNPVTTDHFNFKLYKGYNTTADNLVFKQEFVADVYPIKLPVSQFEEGQVYTWVLVQVFLEGKKSDKGHSSFKIAKK